MAKTAIECKQLGHEVANFGYKHWADNAKKLCMKGLDVKFMQNPCAMQALLETVGVSRIHRLPSRLSHCISPIAISLIFISLLYKAS